MLSSVNCSPYRSSIIRNPTFSSVHSNDLFKNDFPSGLFSLMKKTSDDNYSEVNPLTIFENSYPVAVF
jgi:hypothetical protein